MLQHISGDAAIEAVRNKLVLPEAIPEYRTSAEKIPILIFAARAGSSYSGQLLGKHPAFGRVAEWFNPDHLARLRSENALVNDAETVQSVLDQQDNQVFCTKCTLFGLTSCALLGCLDQILPRAHFILLKRRDPVAHAVSLTKAQMTGQYSIKQRQTHHVGIDDYDRGHIDHNLRLIASIYARLDAFLDRIGKPALRVFYEDIVREPAAFQSQIFRHLDITPTSVRTQKTSIEKIAEEVNAAWIERFKRET